MIKRLFFAVTTLAVLLTGCKDNDSFSASPDQRLTFSVDTVKMDTLFSAVPSSTYNFWAFNRSGNGIRIKSVRLERGNQSGFRVNVDGTFLNPLANDLELRSDDSLRIFVEATTHENMQPEPQLVEDNLLFTLESGVEQRVNLRTVSWDAEKMTNLVVSSDMTIESERPIVVYGDGIRVEKDATLTVKNTTLYFHGNAGIVVEGRLEAEGCLFRGDRLDHMFDYLPYDRVSGQWQGITLLPKVASCEMKRCEIRSACDGIMADSAVVKLNNTVIHNCRGYGLFASDSEVVVDGCQISNTLNDCLAVLGCQATVDHTTLAQFYPLSANRGFAINFGKTEKPLKLNCTNTLITGYNDDVLLGEPRVAEQTEYIFENCLIRTPVVNDADAFKDIVWEKTDDEWSGEKHFERVDADNLIYDFRIKAESPAYTKGIGWIREEDKKE